MRIKKIGTAKKHQKRKKQAVFSRVPNGKTIKALKDVESGNLIGPFNSIDDLMKELES